MYLFQHRNSINRFWSLRGKAKQNKGILRLLYINAYYKFLQRNGASIPLSAEISECPEFPHGLNGIFISSDARIGKQAVIFQQVTIGSNKIKDSKGYGAPILGDHVLLGAGSKVIGGISIGSNVRIGANCIVAENIPDNATVVMPHPRIISREQ